MWFFVFLFAPVGRKRFQKAIPPPIFANGRGARRPARNGSHRFATAETRNAVETERARGRRRLKGKARTRAASSQPAPVPGTGLADGGDGRTKTFFYSPVPSRVISRAAAPARVRSTFGRASNTATAEVTHRIIVRNNARKRHSSKPAAACTTIFYAAAL